MRLDTVPKTTSWRLLPVLAVKDLRHEWLVYSALTLSIVSVVTLLLLLFGLKTGVVQTLREILLKDPRNLEVIIFENTRLTPAWFDKRRADSALVRFVIPRTRSLNTMVDVESQDNYLLKHVELIPTAAGDPLLPSDLAPPQRATDVLLTHAAAAQLGMEQGGTLKAWFKRKLDGADQREAVTLRVISIVPESAFARPALFVTLAFLEALEDYRDGYAVPALYAGADETIPPSLFPLPESRSLPSLMPLECTASDASLSSLLAPEAVGTEDFAWPRAPVIKGLTAATSPTPDKTALTQGKVRTAPRGSYAGARLYARNPEDVTRLADSLRRSGMDVRTRVEDIARLQAADRLLGRILGLIAMIALVCGYLAFGGAIWISIERKRTTLALFRLLGLSGRQIIGFCLQQTMMLGTSAFAISYLFYWLGASALNHYGASLFLELLKAEAPGILLCQLHLREGLIAAVATLLLTLAASLLGALHAKSFQPAECLREV